MVAQSPEEGEYYCDSHHCCRMVERAVHFHTDSSVENTCGTVNRMGIELAPKGERKTLGDTLGDAGDVVASCPALISLPQA